MNSILKRNLFFVKEHTGVFKAANNFDIFDPNTNELILECREENMGFFTKMLRFTDYKRMTPFNIELRTPTGEKILTVKRGFTWFVSTVDVLNENDKVIGRFKQQFFSIGGKFTIFDPEDRNLCTLQGKWTSWDFRFMREQEEFAHISKKWGGIGRELFTTADNYIIEINNSVPPNDPLRMLILAAVMCIDMVLKE